MTQENNIIPINAIEKKKRVGQKECCRESAIFNTVVRISLIGNTGFELRFKVKVDTKVTE